MVAKAEGFFGRSTILGDVGNWLVAGGLKVRGVALVERTLKI